MPTPNGGLITETNRQYYAGAQQFYITSAGVGQTFTSTFDTNLVFDNSDPASNGYNLNNFKIFTSPDANVWAELTPTSPTASTTGTTDNNAYGPGAAVTVTITANNTNVLAGMSLVNVSTGAVYGTVTSITGPTQFVCNLTVQIPVSTNLRFQFSSPWAMLSPNIITVNASLSIGTYLKIQLNENTLGESLGNYSYTRLDDVIDNFLIAYVGTGKLIPSVKRTDVIFHARRGLQEFSYDTLKSIKSAELGIPVSLSLQIPQDYVNYVRLAWVDKQGVLHTIQPAEKLTSRPYYTPAQDDAGVPTQDSNSNNLEVTSKVNAAWDANDPRNISGAYTEQYSEANIYWQGYYNGALGQRYGLQPQISQKNGWFEIDERKGTFNFTSELSNKVIVLEYISDGNSYDLDLRIPKLAEEALYAHIIHAILSTSANVQEYVVRRFKQERSAKLRNAKIRLSNLKLDQMIQTMRGKSKWLKY